MFDDDDDEKVGALASPPLTEIRVAKFDSYIVLLEGPACGATNAKVGNKKLDTMKEYAIDNIIKSANLVS
jgi:uncharacterized protein YbbK (DUF523 family)